MTQHIHGAPVAWLYRNAGLPPERANELSFTRLDNYYHRPGSDDEHDYIKGEALVLESETKGTVMRQIQREQRVYIAGPMTGIPDHNFPAFNAAAELLRRSGLLVENPADHGIVAGATWVDYLAYDITRLGLCGTIYLLPGWSHSRGATLEHKLARALQMRVIYAPGAENWPEQPL